LVPNNTYRYTVTAIFASWTGASAPSNPVTVVGDITAPLQTVTLATGPVGAYLTGTTLFVRTITAGSLNFVNSVTDVGVGPASSTFPAITTTGWTHAAETVTNGTGTAPTKAYTSSPVTWTAGAGAPTNYAITGRDANNNAATTNLTVWADNAAPTGGVLTVNGVAATAAGSTSNARTAFTIGARTNYVDAATGTNPASGLASTNLIMDSAPFINGFCGTNFANPVVVAGTTNPPLTSGNCYRYTLTGIDQVGNTSSLSTIVKYDATLPTNVVSMPTRTGAYFGINRIYVRTNTAGSFTLNSAVTDTASGPASVTYPAITSNGWTHPAETVTTSTGILPTLSFVSSTYSWIAGAATPGTMTVVSRDNFTNTTNTSVAFSRDNTAPRRGTLTVNGVTASTAGSTSTTSKTTLTPTGANYIDNNSGLASSVLTMQTAPLAANVCGTYGSATTLTFGTAVSGLTSNCYKFTLTGTDNVGNVASISTTTRVDVNAPVSGAFVINGTPASLATPTITTNSGTLALTGVVNWTDAETAVTGASNSITMASASLANNTCGTFGGAGTAVYTGLGSGCYRYTLTGTDLAGNVSSVALVVKVDTAAPVGGTMAVNGGTANVAGSVTTYSRTGVVAITARTDWTDTNSGLASSVITIKSATLTGNVCGAFTLLSTVPTGTATQTFTTSGCYLYSLVGTDNYGNISTISTTVKVDLLAPVAGALTVNGTAASTAGSTSITNASFPIVRTDYTDGETGVTSTLTVAATTYTAGTCGATFGGATTLTGAPTQTGLAVGCYRYTLTGTDTAGNTASISTIVKYDPTAPIGGALTVNGIAASVAGTTSTTNAVSFPINVRTDYTDANSGLVSSTLTVAFAPLTNSTCGTFAEATVITGNPTQTGLATGCYRYVLTGTDTAGNTSSISTTVTQGARATAVTLVNGVGGVAGRIDAGDSIVITFSDQVRVSTLCSTWTGDTSNQVLNGSNQVTATLTNGGASDTMTLASSACTLNFGTLSLGSTGYTTANINFAGAGAAATTLSWNATTHQLTVKLGTASGAGAATVANSVVTYTPAAAVLTSNGVAFGGTFNTALQQWF
jgi:hypothetical protein